MASYEDLEAQIASLREAVEGRRGRPRKTAIKEEVVYEEAPVPRRIAPARIAKTAPAPKTGVELRPARPEPRVPVRSTHRCNCPDCPHKS